MAIVREARLVCADVGANNNKFWNAWLHDDGRIETEYGRIGVTATREFVSKTGEKAFDGLIKKKKEGKKNPDGSRHSQYTESHCIEVGASKTVVKAVDGDLHTIAKKQIATTSPLCNTLIERLVKENVHKITSSTNISFNAATGQFTTPLGIVTPAGIAEGRDLLARIHKWLGRSHSGPETIEQIVNKYLRIVPQNVGMKLDLNRLFPDTNAIQRQLDLLDGMEAAATAPQTGTPKEIEERVFAVSMDLATPADHDRIRAYYRSSRKDMHVCAHLDVKVVYTISIETMARGFEVGKKCGNILELWHGTRSANVLSILKSGLKCSPPSTAAIAGKLFGNGIYFSDQSTKSLNYAYGYWQGSGSRDENCFMFLANVAMGNPFMPKGYGNRYAGGGGFPVKGYDSTFAKGGESGVMNNEMIVYNDNQCNLVYLVEFSPKGK